MKMFELSENSYSAINQNKSNFDSMPPEEKKQYFINMGEDRNIDPMILAIRKQQSHHIKDNSYVKAVVGEDAYQELRNQNRIAKLKNGQLTVLTPDGTVYKRF